MTISALTLRSSSILVCALAAETAVMGDQRQDFWAHAELAQGEEQGEECDVSLLQASLHTSLDNSQVRPQLHSHASRKGHSHKEMPRAPESVSFFQGDEELGKLSFFQDSMTMETSIAKNAGLSLVSEEHAGLHGYLTPEQLVLSALVLKLLAAFSVVFKGAMSFTRLLTERRKTFPCEQSITPEAKTERVIRKDKDTETEMLNQINELPWASAEKIESLLSKDAGYDCTLPKPRKMGKAQRVRVRIHGPVNDSDSLLAPVTQQACVLYHATARRRLAKNAETTEGSVVGTCRGSVDFMANLENYPDITFTVRGDEVEMFSMHSGSSTTCSTLREASNMRHSMVCCQEGAALEDEEFVFEEWALRIGEVVTLVGDLHCDALGALSLWPAPKRLRPAREAADETSTSIFDDRHVFASDNPQLEAPTEESPV
eukprot:TRINITY_DN18359_c0_g1_i1.p1 TRINITY_DN18359_c0_g1~~TRINITY_DN18359_c0_g1_i1.p1  ORF type:complete len:430 (+),score=68.03 TRINITY_DN18359_c0_g1_i1:170-1459(+)